MTRCVCATLLVAALSLAVRGANDSPALTLAHQLNDAFVEVAEKVSPSVVVIKLAHKPGSIDIDDEDNPFWEFVPKEFRKQFEQERDKRRKRTEEAEPPDRPPVFDSQGSGVIIRDDGYILTNFHVVEDAEKIRVRLRDGRTFEGTVRGKDSRSDLAVIKINATNLPAAKLGDSAAVRVGEFAIAIGAPFELDYSVTFGHVSAKGRSRVVLSMGVMSPGAMMDQDFIQTDASINPGNSGGPLVNLYGEVIGINTAIRGIGTGIGFAVPSNIAKQVADHLIKDGKFTRSRIGIEIRDLRDDQESKPDFPGVEDGVVVRAVLADGPAAKSDLRAGDVVTAVDGRPVKTS